VVELLFPCGEHEVRAAVHAFQNPILKSRHGTILRKRRNALPFAPPVSYNPNLYNPNSTLFDFPATLFPVPFPCKSLLYPQLLTRLQIKRMPLYFFDDVFLLHLALKATKGVFQSFTILESNFSQLTTPPNQPQFAPV
jgi:hypothetical protein